MTHAAAAAAGCDVVALRKRRNKPCRIALELQSISHRNGLVKIMLFREHSANETFPSTLESGKELSRDDREPARQTCDAWERPAPDVTQGDEVVFERLDLAEILGIWRHARGRVVGIHRQAGGATVDVQFQGHDTLE